MRLGLLGPLLVEHDGTAVAVTAGKQRVILAALLLRAGQGVSAHQLAEVIWDGVPPASAGVTVRSHVRSLRRSLGPAVGARIITVASGYLVEATGAEIDIREFASLCQDGSAAVRSRAWPRAWDVLGKALSLWRGAPLADIPSETLRRDQVHRLDLLRLQAAQWRADAGLALGRHEELALELQDLCNAHPLREPFRAQLMLALYRSGRQADALSAYQQGRQALAEELGVNPGTELRELHHRILASSARVP